MKNINITKRIIAIIIIILLIPTLFAVLRATHIILKVGGYYKSCFSEKYIVNMDRAVNDDNIDEIVHMKNLKKFSAIDTDLSNINFITEFEKLVSLCYVGHSDNPKTILKEIPTLKNSPNLEYIYLYNVNVESLDFLKESENAKYVYIVNYNRNITDISALQDKDELKILHLENVLCDDYSVLLELDSLKNLDLIGTPLPDNIKEKLIENGVEVNEYDFKK